MDEQLDYSPLDTIKGISTAVDGSFRKTIVAYYSIRGTRLSSPKEKGITIIKYADGTSRKIITR